MKWSCLSKIKQQTETSEKYMKLGKEPRKETESAGGMLQVEEKLTYHGRVLDFIKCLFASIEVMHFFPLHSINAIYYIWFFFFLLRLEVLRQRLDCRWHIHLYFLLWINFSGYRPRWLISRLFTHAIGFWKFKTSQDFNSTLRASSWS